MPDENNDGQNANANDQTTMADIAAGLPAGSDDEGSQAAASAAAAAKDDGNKTDMEKFIQTQNQNMESLKNEVTSANEKVTEIVNREQQGILDKAVDNAVANITDGVEGKTKLADTFLNTAYRNDPNFKKIFDARIENPDAYGKALGVLKEEFKAMTLNTIDPQIAENQRALQDSQRQGQSAHDVSETDRLNKLPDGNFLSDMRKLARAG